MLPKSVAATFIYVLFSGCCPSEQPSKAVDMVILRAAIDDGNAKWIAAMKNADASAVAACWAEDGQMLGRDGKNVVGRAAIETQMETLFSRRGAPFDATVSTFDVRVQSNNRALEAGRYTTTWIGPQSDTTIGGGRYLVVWERKADGPWEAVASTGLSESAPDTSTTDAGE